MDFLSIILIAIGLSMDSFAVSVCNGMILKKSKRFVLLKIAFIFAFVQFLFPVSGWLLGIVVSSYISKFDHWIAFLLLSYIGIKMIIESRKDEECPLVDLNNIWNIIMMAVATSIDAMVIGLSFALIGSSIFLPALIIGIVTFIACLVGMHLGQRASHLFPKKAELIGGLVLVGIGVKILVEHLFF